MNNIDLDFCFGLLFILANKIFTKRFLNFDSFLFWFVFEFSANCNQYLFVRSYSLYIFHYDGRYSSADKFMTGHLFINAIVVGRSLFFVHKQPCLSFGRKTAGGPLVGWMITSGNLIVLYTQS